MPRYAFLPKMKTQPAFAKNVRHFIWGTQCPSIWYVEVAETYVKIIQIVMLSNAIKSVHLDNWDLFLFILV